LIMDKFCLGLRELRWDAVKYWKWFLQAGIIFTDAYDIHV